MAVRLIGISVLLILIPTLFSWLMVELYPLVTSLLLLIAVVIQRLQTCLPSEYIYPPLVIFSEIILEHEWQKIPSSSCLVWKVLPQASIENVLSNGGLQMSQLRFLVKIR